MATYFSRPGGSANTGYGTAYFLKDSGDRRPGETAFEYVIRKAQEGYNELVNKVGNSDVEIDPTGYGHLKPKTKPEPVEDASKATAQPEQSVGDSIHSVLQKFDVVPKNYEEEMATDVKNNGGGLVPGLFNGGEGDAAAGGGGQQPAPTQPQPPSTTTKPEGQNQPLDMNAVVNAATIKGVQDDKAKADAAKAEAEARAQAQAAWQKEYDRQKQLQDWYGQPPERDRLNMTRPVLNNLELDYVRRLTDLKNIHDGADEYSKNDPLGRSPDQIRQWASDSAALLRQEAQAAGVRNLDEYGSDVTLRDALRYYASNQARAGADTRNRYEETAEDFYNRRFDDYIREGRGSRIAEYLAGKEAREYQRKRAAFFEDRLNAYGREGAYLNDIGLVALNRIAEENPTLANILAKSYKTPKDFDDRQNTLFDNAAEQAGKMDEKWLSAYLNALQAERGYGYDLGKIDRTYDWIGRNQENSQYRTHVYRTKEKEQEAQIKAQETIAAFNNKIGFANRLFSKGSITENQYNALIASAYDFTGAASIFGVGKGTSGDPTKARRDALNGYSNQLKITSENLRKRLKEINAQIGWGKPTPEQQAQIDDLSQQIADVDAHLAEVTEQYSDLIEQTAPPRFSMDNLEGSYANAQDFVAQAQKAGYSEAQIKEALIKELKANKFTDDVINKITNGLFPSEVSRAVQQGAAALNKR